MGINPSAAPVNTNREVLLPQFVQVVRGRFQGRTPEAPRWCTQYTTIKVWDGTTYGLLATLTGHTDAVLSVAFSTDGPPRIVSGSYDRTIKVWDGTTYGLLTTLCTGSTLCTGHTDWVNSVAFSTGGPPRIVSGSADKTIKVWAPSL